MRTLSLLVAALAAFLLPAAPPASALEAPECPAEPLAFLEGRSTTGGPCSGCGGGWIEVRIRERVFCIACPQGALGPVLP